MLALGSELLCGLCPLPVSGGGGVVAAEMFVLIEGGVGMFSPYGGSGSNRCVLCSIWTISRVSLFVHVQTNLVM